MANLWALIYTIVAVSSQPLHCSDEPTQLFPIGLNVIGASGEIIYSSETGSHGGAYRKICHEYRREDFNLGPRLDNLAWTNFTDLSTVQFVLPHSLVAVGAPKIASVQIIGSKKQPHFGLYYQDSYHHADSGIVSIDYPPQRASNGDPAHLTLFETNDDGAITGGDKLMAVWVSFSRPDSDYNCTNYDHCCNITGDLLDFNGKNCPLVQPQWGCYTPDGKRWEDGQAVGSINYLGSLADGGSVMRNKHMAGTRADETVRTTSSLLLHLADTADVSAAITNTYAEHLVIDSPSCRALCASVVKQGPSMTDLHNDTNAAKCNLTSAPNFKAKSYDGLAITVNGFGRIDGRSMMEAFSFQGKSVWTDPAGERGLPLNGYGGAVGSFKTVADAEAHTRWRVMSGLLELSTSATGTGVGDSSAPRRPGTRSTGSSNTTGHQNVSSAGSSDGSSAGTPGTAPGTGTVQQFAIDVSEITVSAGPKRGDGSIRLQFTRVPLDSGHALEDSNEPVSLYDVKSPAAWVDAADGPRVTSNHSRFEFVFLHHCDDNLKVDSSHSTFKHLTLLQGNIGSAVELGTYGIGLRQNTVVNATVDGVYIHRITHDGGQEDQVGSVLGSRTCPWGITLANITVQNLYIPYAGGSNRVSALFKIGTYGAPNAAFAQNTPLDRWYFCSNPWWLDSETIKTNRGETAATLTGLKFLRWRVMTRPTNISWLYNFHPLANTTIADVQFFESPDDNFDSAVQIFPDYDETKAEPDQYFFLTCFGNLVGDPTGRKCWDKEGEIFLRRMRRCDSFGSLGDCNNFQLLGEANSTTCQDISFPHGDYMRGGNKKKTMVRGRGEGEREAEQPGAPGQGR
jgi:hypothetical protein